LVLKNIFAWHVSVFDALPEFHTKKKTAGSQEQQINTKLCRYHTALNGLICFLFFHFKNTFISNAVTLYSFIACYGVLEPEQLSL
jgi:hypothetical protein